jgi:hypothetical protein
MCPVCATSAALTAAAATSAATAFATLGVDLARLFLAAGSHWRRGFSGIYDQIRKRSSR